MTSFDDERWPLDGAGPAVPIAPARAREIVRGAIAAALPRPAEPAGARGRSPRAVLLGVLVVLLGAGTYLAIATREQREAGIMTSRPAPNVPEPSPPVELGGSATLPTVDPSVLVGDLPDAPRPTGRFRAAASGSPWLAPSAVAHSSAPLAKRPAATPADLLREANRLRSQSDWLGAAALYSRVASARASESHVATIALASLRWEKLGDPTGAIQLYRAALSARDDGPLAEEARWGIAEAERSRADRAAEAKALREFLSRHGSSLRAPEARQRLAGLEKQ